MDVRSARQPFEPFPGRVEHPPLRRRGDAPGNPGAGGFDRILDLEPIGPVPLPSPGNPGASPMREPSESPIRWGPVRGDPFPGARAGGSDGEAPAHRGTLIDIRV